MADSKQQSPNLGTPVYVLQDLIDLDETYFVIILFDIPSVVLSYRLCEMLKQRTSLSLTASK